MDEAEELSELIGAIYDAALDPGLWRQALSGCAQFINGVGAAVYSKNVSSRSGDVFYQVGTEPEYEASYFNTYIRMDPCTTGQYFMDVDVASSRSDLISDEEFFESRFYKEWVKPQGLVDGLWTVLDRTATSVALFAVFRDELRGNVDAEMRRRMLLVAPHVRRAIMIDRIVDIDRNDNETFANVLDGLAAGVIFVSPSCRIMHTNKSARQMLDSSNALYVSRDRLVSNDPVCNQALIDAIAAASNGDVALAAKGISMPLKARDGEDHVAHILPLKSGARRKTSDAYFASAAVFVHKPNSMTVAGPEALTKTFNLTPSELRVFMAIAEVGGVPEAAEALGISLNTVKSHLQRIFAKTGAGRQADLVKLLSAYASPFRD